MERRSFLAAVAAPAVSVLPSLPLERAPELLPPARRFTVAEVFAPDNFAPRSLIEPVEGDGYIEWTLTGNETMQTRDEALADCAEWNRKSMAEGSYMPGDAHNLWHVIVEIGEDSEPPLLMVEMDADGAGRARYEREWHCRLVHPTAAERAAFPMPAEAKGGAQ